jgi:hypothetical protein
MRVVFHPPAGASRQIFAARLTHTDLLSVVHPLAVSKHGHALLVPDERGQLAKLLVGQVRYGCFQYALRTEPLGVRDVFGQRVPTNAGNVAHGAQLPSDVV